MPNPSKELAACETGGWIADIIRIYVNKLYFVFIRDLFDYYWRVLQEANFVLLLSFYIPA